MQGTQHWESCQKQLWCQSRHVFLFWQRYAMLCTQGTRCWESWFWEVWRVGTAPLRGIYHICVVGPEHLQSPSMPRNASHLAGFRIMYVVNDIHPARSLAFIGHVQDMRCPGPQHRYGGFPLEGQSKLVAPLKTKTLSATSLACRALHNVAKTKKRVYPDVTIVFHVPKSPRLSPPLF